MTDEIYDVAVVGYGPTGLAAASLLGRLGRTIAVVERWPSLYGLPRATHIDDETARIVQAAGTIDDALRDSSVTEYEWFNGKGDRLLRIPAVAQGRMGYPEHLSIYQPDIEATIDARVRSLPNVTVLQGWALVNLDLGPDDVTLEIEPWRRAEGERRQLSARYVIAADGAKSRVRELLEIERDDFGFNERWLNIDTVRRRPLAPEFDGARQFCDPARGHMSMSIGLSRQRFEFALLEHEDIGMMTQPEAGWKLLRSHYGLGPDDVEFLRQLVYVFESCVARSWNRGRVYLAGDAAHTMPPYLGQGACSGLRDALNLAWKLSFVLDGKASPELLDTYESERRPHAEALIQMSIGLGTVANMRDSVAAEKRDAAFLAGQAPPPPSMPVLATGVVRRAHDATTNEPRAGELTPQGRIKRDGRTGRFDDVVGLRFALVAREDPSDALGSERMAFLAELDCAVLELGSFDDLDGTYEAFLDHLNAHAFVARPDFYLFGTASDSAQLAALVDDLRIALRWLPTPAPTPA